MRRLVPALACVLTSACGSLLDPGPSQERATPTHIAYAIVHPDSRVPYGSSSEIKRSDGTSMNVVYAAPAGDVLGRLAMSPDARWLAFEVTSRESVVDPNPPGVDVLDVQTGAIVARIAYGSHPSYSPTGRLAIATDRGVVTIDGPGKPAVLDATLRTTTRVAWSSADQPLVFTTEVMDPVVSPDGRRIAYVDGAYDLWVANIDLSGAIKLAPWASEPTWSPDGLNILFLDAFPVQGTRRVPSAGGPETIAYVDSDWIARIRGVAWTR